MTDKQLLLARWLLVATVLGMAAITVVAAEAGRGSGEVVVYAITTCLLAFCATLTLRNSDHLQPVPIPRDRSGDE